jgi:hypothetical protein
VKTKHEKWVEWVNDTEPKGSIVYDELLKREWKPVNVFKSNDDGELLWIVSFEDDFWICEFDTEEELNLFIKHLELEVIA